MTQVGAGEKVAVTVETRSPVACRFEAGRLDVKILSGEQTMYDSSRCDRDRETTPLLLASGMSWKGSVDWDGRVYSGCQAVDGNTDGAHDIADAGTYRAQVIVGSLPVGSEKVFVVQ